MLRRKIKDAVYTCLMAVFEKAVSAVTPSDGRMSRWIRQVSWKGPYAYSISTISDSRGEELRMKIHAAVSVSVQCKGFIGLLQLGIALGLGGSLSQPNACFRRHRTTSDTSLLLPDLPSRLLLGLILLLSLRSLFVIGVAVDIERAVT